MRKILESKTKDELIGIRRRLQIKGASNLNKSDLIEVLLQHPELSKTLAHDMAEESNSHNSSGFSKINLLAATVFFLIMFALFWYGRLNPTESKEFVNSDEIVTYITLIQDIKTGQLYSLTDYTDREVYPIQFKNYKKSLKYIDRLANNGSITPEISYGKYWKYEFSLENKRNLLIYSFWRWMMQFSQSYMLSFEAKDTGLTRSRNGTLVNDEDIKERVIIDSSNELLTKHETRIFLPEKSKFEKSKFGYIIETEHSKFAFNFSQGSQQQISYNSNTLINKIYNELNLDKEESQNEITFTIQIQYLRKKLDDDASRANFEYAWFKTIKNNIIEDYEFETVKKKFLEM